MLTPSQGRLSSEEARRVKQKRGSHRGCVVRTQRPGGQKSEKGVPMQTKTGMDSQEDPELLP